MGFVPGIQAVDKNNKKVELDFSNQFPQMQGQIRRREK